MYFKKKRFPPAFIAIEAILLNWIIVLSAGAYPDYYYPNATVYTNGSVRSVVFYEGKLYVGGFFTKVTDKNGTYSRSDVAAYDVSTWLVTPFKANANTGTVRSIVAGNGKVYIGGSFTKINNVSCSKVAAVDPITGDVATDFRGASATINGRVWALALSDNFLYIGGSFDSIDGYARKDLASVDKDNGSLNLLFDPEPNDPWNDSGKTPGGIYALKIHPQNPQIVFVGGNYQAIAGSYENPYCTVLRSDGQAATQFQPKLTYPVKNFDAHDSTLYIGIGGYANRIAAFDIGHGPYNRLWRSMFTQGDAQAVAYSNQGYVYFGFHQGLFDTTDAFRMAAVDAETGELVEAYPPMNSFLGVEALAAQDSFLAVGGEFTRMNDLPQKYLAVLKTTSFVSLPPATPVLSEPADGEIGTSVYPLLKWKFAPRAQTYELGMSASDTEFFYSNLTGIPFVGLAYQCTDLKSGSWYWWKVRACNKAGKSDWSPVWRFATLPGDDDLPIVISPLSGAIDQPVSLDFIWHKTKTALSYGIQVSEFVDYSVNIADQSGIADTTFHISGLENDKAYFWRLNAVTPGGETVWRLLWFRTIIASPGAPQCVWPVNYASQIVSQTDLRWKRVAAATSYRIQLSTNRGFDTVLRDTAGVIDTSINVAGLVNDTRYFWRVSAMNIGGEVWSSTMQFTTVYPFPCVPFPLCPANGSVVKNDSLRALWKKSNPHVTRYCIEIAKDAKMTNAFIDSANVDTEFTSYHLSDKANYWWRVRAYNQSGWSAYSETMLFKTAFPSIVENRYSLDRFAFFGKNGSIDYSIAEPGDVQLELVDIRGKTVWKTVRQNRNPGLNKEILPASAMPAGAYFLSIKAGSFAKTADATLIR